ncbi:MAG: primosomal protein N' [Deltaproteobacteria bacterium]|nr:MAG: primosomal protein N' [Deltaproteobacteria bacterium]
MFAEVAIARPVPGPFTYAVPAWLSVEVGHVVLVPFGRTSETGYVVGLRNDPGDVPADKVKAVQRLVDDTIAFDARQLDFFRWVSRYYLTPLGVVIQTALPKEIRAKTLLVLHPTDDGVEALTRRQVEGSQAQVLREVIGRRGGLTRRGLIRRLQDELDKSAVESAIDALVRAGLAMFEEKEVKEMRGMVRVASLTDVDPLVAAPRAGKRMRAVIEALQRAGGEMDVPELTAEQGSTVSAALTRLEELGVVELTERERRDPLDEEAPLGPAEPPPLNHDQLQALLALTQPDADGTYVLFGVTGSGKTEVFLGAARHVLGEGRQVLVLVPEIGLTPQLVGRFKGRFGEGVAVLHSGLTGAERLAEWRRIRAGEARIAVGARSALFAPFEDLGLIVVDEEHDDSYKQDDGLRYNARDLAVVLGTRHKCPVVLASATPSMESWFNAKQGRYTMLRLPRRATPRPVPDIELVDMTEVEPGPDGKREVFAKVVIEALRETFVRGGQAVVLYNRRGYATMVQCTSCGGTWECPNCGITMTLHQRSRTLACHYCGLKRPYTEECPSCGKPGLEELGKGTEKVEEVLARHFPHVAIGRMDADTTAVRGAHHRILKEFREGRTRLLVGTQIIAKGHDFPGVQTAVVVSADHGFRMPDFRAAERTAALLVQLAGRAGRGDMPGRVFLQTWKPDHYALQDLGDIERFYERELRIRDTLRYPPHTRLVLLRIDGVDRRAVQEASRQLSQALSRSASRAPGVEILGPAPAAMARLVGRWRFQIVLRGRDLGVFRRWLGDAARLFKPTLGKGVRLHVDVDPRHLM